MGELKINCKPYSKNFLKREDYSLTIFGIIINTLGIYTRKWLSGN